MRRRGSGIEGHPNLSLRKWKVRGGSPLSTYFGRTDGWWAFREDLQADGTRLERFCCECDRCIPHIHPSSSGARVHPLSLFSLYASSFSSITPRPPPRLPFNVSSPSLTLCFSVPPLSVHLLHYDRFLPCVCPFPRLLHRLLLCFQPALSHVSLSTRLSVPRSQVEVKIGG